MFSSIRFTIITSKIQFHGNILCKDSNILLCSTSAIEYMVININKYIQLKFFCYKTFNIQHRPNVCSFYMQLIQL